MPDDSPVRILVVEPHTLFRKVLVNLLGKQPEFQVAGEATSGRDALRKARESRPDIILMDVCLPGMDGLQATRRIHQEIPDIKIVMLTVADDDQRLVEAVKSGAQAYVRKEIEPEDLFDILRRVSRGEPASY